MVNSHSVFNLGYSEIMNIDPRLNEIDDCLYRVATKAMIVHDNKVLLVKEVPDIWWDFPGGGIDHGEKVEEALLRELGEELGVNPSDISTDFKIVHTTIGTVVNNIPRMNVYLKVKVPHAAVKKTDHVSEWQWFTRSEFMNLDMSPSNSERSELAKVIFDQ